MSVVCRAPPKRNNACTSPRVGHTEEQKAARAMHCVCESTQAARPHYHHPQPQSAQQRAMHV
jgi:hypothetical protein